MCVNVCVCVWGGGVAANHGGVGLQHMAEKLAMQTEDLSLGRAGEGCSGGWGAWRTGWLGARRGCEVPVWWLAFIG